MPKHTSAGAKRTRKSTRAKRPPHVSWTGRVARKIKTSIKKLVG